MAYWPGLCGAISFLRYKEQM